MSGSRVFLGLGASLGPREAHLSAAVRALAAEDRFVLLSRSGVYRTEPLGDPAGRPFLNMALAGIWSGDPRALLAACQRIERQRGRTRSYPNAARTLDIDLLLWEGLWLSEPDLEVPHPRLCERAFALVPLLELEPEAVHPKTGRPLSSYLSAALLAQGMAPLRTEIACV